MLYHIESWHQGSVKDRFVYLPVLELSYAATAEKSFLRSVDFPASATQASAMSVRQNASSSHTTDDLSSR
jgi:hypothetical protein